MTYTLTIEPYENEYKATCAAFPGLSAFGPTPEDAKREGEVALKGFIEAYQAEGRELPPMV